MLLKAFWQAFNKHSDMVLTNILQMFWRAFNKHSDAIFKTHSGVQAYIRMFNNTAV